jgi:hypothetical protein
MNRFLPSFLLIRSLSAAARIPSIKFLGKRVGGSPQASSHINSAPIASSKAKTITASVSTTAVDHNTLKGGAWFGRPILTSSEMLAIESGGATSIL